MLDSLENLLELEEVYEYYYNEKAKWKFIYLTNIEDYNLYVDKISEKYSIANNIGPLFQPRDMVATFYKDSNYANYTQPFNSVKKNIDFMTQIEMDSCLFIKYITEKYIVENNIKIPN